MAGMRWSEAMAAALYGPGGFYLRGTGPAGHFRTSVHASPLFAAALARLARAAGLRAVVDVGAGRGELLRDLHRADPGLQLTAVEVAPRPTDLPAALGWVAEIPSGVDALLVANEWLDNVPIDVVTVDRRARLREVLVDPASGQESLGRQVAAGASADWLARWWPLAGCPQGTRAEVGLARDAAWAAAVGSLGRGLAVAIDYGHTAADRPSGGTLRGYRGGRRVPPVPDGSCDLTADVGLDACAAASAGSPATLLLPQRIALKRLGVAAELPDRALAGTDPVGYGRALEEASHAAELVDPSGLGSFTWLVQAVDIDLPPILTA